MTPKHSPSLQCAIWMLLSRAGFSAGGAWCDKGCVSVHEERRNGERPHEAPGHWPKRHPPNRTNQLAASKPRVLFLGGQVLTWLAKGRGVCVWVGGTRASSLRILSSFPFSVFAGSRGEGSRLKAWWWWWW